MKTRWILLLLIGWLLIFNGNSHAVVYWISTSGSDGNACTSIDSADEQTDPGTYRATFNGGETCASAGDTVLFKDGNYANNNKFGLSKSGTSGNLITYKSQNLLGAKVVGASSSSENWAINLSASFVRIQGFDIHGWASTGGGGGGMQITGNNNVISQNHFRDLGNVCITHVFGQGGMYASGTSNNTVERNVFSNIGRYRPGESGCSSPANYTQNDHGIYFGNGVSGWIVRNNIFYNNDNGYAVQFYPSSASNIKVYKNTFIGSTPDNAQAAILVYLTGAGLVNVNFEDNIFQGQTNVGIRIDPATGTVTGCTVKNNITDKSAITNPSSRVGCTYSGNIISSSTINFVDSGNRNYALQSSSAAIDQGIATVGGDSIPFNGSAPDIGAHETLVFATCSVEQGDASTLRVSYTSNVFPPLGGISTAGFTYRINAGASNTPNAAVLNGSNSVFLTLQAAVTAGQTIDFSYTTAGSLRDSANIGGTHQRVNAITTQGCTNNVSGGAPTNLTVSHFRFHGFRSSSTSSPEANRYVLASTDINATVISNALFAVRVKIKCTGADCPPTAFNLRYRKNETGSYVNIPDTCGADGIKFAGTSAGTSDIPTNGAATTEQLTSDFSTNVAGAIVRTADAIPTIDLAQDSETEVEYLLQFCSAPLDTIFDFRPYKQDGNALDAYTFTPRTTVASSRFLQ